MTINRKYYPENTIQGYEIAILAFAILFLHIRHIPALRPELNFLAFVIFNN